MIVELFANPVFTILNALVNSFPSLMLPFDLLEGITSLLAMANTLEEFVPVYYCLTLVGAYWFIVNGKLFIALIMWVYEKIPFI